MDTNNEGEGKTGWQRSIRTPENRLAHIYIEGCLSDLTVTLANQATFKVHRLILAMSSPVFEVLLYSSREPGRNHTLHLPHEETEAFTWLLDHMYGEDFILPSVDLAIQILHLADRYEMEQLTLSCTEFVGWRLTTKNVFAAYNVASNMRNKQLAIQCSKYMSRSSEALWTTEEFCQLSRDALHHLVKTNRGYPQTVVLRSIMLWGRCHISTVNTEDQDDYQEKLLEQVKVFLPFINFTAMTINEFQEHVVPCDILPPAQVESIINIIREREQKHEEGDLTTAPYALTEVPLPKINKLLDIIPKKENHILYVNGEMLRSNQHQEKILTTHFRPHTAMTLRKVTCDELPNCSIVAEVKDSFFRIIQKALWCDSSKRFTDFLQVYPNMTCTITLSIHNPLPSKINFPLSFVEVLPLFAGKELVYEKGPVEYYWRFLE